MTSKALRKQLLAAVAMVLVAAIAVSSSTFAWFAMSKTVTATGMTVTAKTDAIFLEINGTEDSGAYGLTGTNALDAQLYPAHHEAWTALANVTDFDLNDDSTNDNWYYRFNANSDNATNAMGDKNYIGAFTDYVAVTSYNVRLHPGSAATGYDLYVSNITIPADKGITVVIAGANGYKEFSAADNGAIAFAAADILSDTVTETPQVINVYIYFNGDDSHVYTDNITALTGSVTFQLSCFEADNP